MFRDYLLCSFEKRNGFGVGKLAGKEKLARPFEFRPPLDERGATKTKKQGPDASASGFALWRLKGARQISTNLDGHMKI